MQIFNRLYQKLFHDKTHDYRYDHKEIFELVHVMFLFNPGIFYWIKEFPGDKQRYIILDFFHDSVYRYRLLEFSVVDKDKMCYFWLPGAMPGGRGYVKPGIYNVSINCMQEQKTTYLCLERNQVESLHLLSVADKESGDASTALLCNYPHRSFYPELRLTALFWLQWHLQVLTCKLFPEELLVNKTAFLDILQKSRVIDKQMMMLAEKIFQLLPEKEKRGK